MNAKDSVRLVLCYARFYTVGIYPREYTDQEGGVFKMWTGGLVSRWSLNKAKRNSYNSYTCRISLVNDIAVHSLIFESASAGGFVSRWDCLNGVTKSLFSAFVKWPRGRHGECDMRRLAND